MRFSIITPTCRRANKLARAVASVQAQTYTDWEMIIVNDSPSDSHYERFASSINDPRIHYHVNHTNKGVNFSRNLALDKVSADSKWVIFLDDDNWLSPDALQVAHELILLHLDLRWFITNKAHRDGTPLTAIKKTDRSYSYILDCLILRRIKDDLTHIIKTEALHKIRFSRYIKQAEEWIFYFQLALSDRMFYHNHNSTITEGRDCGHRPGSRERKNLRQLRNIFVLSYEGVLLGLSFKGTFWISIFVKLFSIYTRAK